MCCTAEPVISGEIMQLHHAKHHATYVANLNKALEQYAEAESKHDLQKMISLQSAINFNGGGRCKQLGTCHPLRFVSSCTAAPQPPVLVLLLAAVTLCGRAC